MSALDREQILHRYMTADETGLIASIPFPCFFKFTSREKPRLSIEIVVGDPNDTKCTSTLNFSIQDTKFMIYDEAGNNKGKSASFVIPSGDMVKENDGRILTKCFGLHILANDKNQCVDIYDLYYYTYADTECEAFNQFKYNFGPCYMMELNGEPRKEHLDYYRDIEYRSNNIALQTSMYSGYVTGVILSSDDIYTEINQIIIDKNELVKMMGVPDATFSDLAREYQYKDGKLRPVTEEILEEDERLANTYAIFAMKNKLRNIQIQSSKWVIEDMLFRKYMPIENVQRFIKIANDQAAKLMHDIAESELHIREQAVLNYRANRTEFIENHKYKYNSAICLITKDENVYLEEWIRHHADIGIDHFYIYDNGSKTPVIDTIKAIDNGKYMDMCTVELYTKYRHHMQYECYEKCLSEHGEETKWMAFIDTDEFIDVNGNDINKFLDDYIKFSGVYIAWEVYGADGHVKADLTKTQKERFTKRIIDPTGYFGKMFVQTARTRFMYVHLSQALDVTDRICDVDHTDHIIHYAENEKKQKLGFRDDWYEICKIRHYFTRSWEEWVNKMKRGSSDPKYLRKMKQFFKFNPDMSYILQDPDLEKLLNFTQPYD